LAESDAQLEKTLNTFLCPVLLKLASPAENVRAKVTEPNGRNSMAINREQKVKNKIDTRNRVSDLSNPSIGLFIDV
jgi:proteasome component ECM29